MYSIPKKKVNFPTPLLLPNMQNQTEKQPPKNIWIGGTILDFLTEPSISTLESSSEEGTSDSQLSTYFTQTKHWHKWLVTHLTFSDKLDILYSDFTFRKDRSGSDRSYRSEVGPISSEWIIKYNCETQFIQGVGIVPGNPEYHNSYQGELGGQRVVMCLIQIIESIMGSN